MLLNLGRKLIPRPVFRFFQPLYHLGLSLAGAIIYRFPASSMKIIAVTGTKGKSTTVYMISKILEEQGVPVAAIGSLGFKIKDRQWPNTLKMTLPGRLKLHKFLYQAKMAGVSHVVLEATSEGIVQNRLAGIKIDCAVFTNLHREHLESHGSFENYMSAKQKLFLKTKNTHVLNIDDPYFEKFSNFPARQKITYGHQWGMINIANTRSQEPLYLQLVGNFNVSNALAALAVSLVYGLDMTKAVKTLNAIDVVPGRMEIIESNRGFKVVVDYAHTPDSLELVYKTLRPFAKKLICVLGAAGGGRDKWKRPEFGKIASEYCDEIILTNEDPYDEDPMLILEQIEKGFGDKIKNWEPLHYRKIIDRKEAIDQAIKNAEPGDVVIVTGKGSETSMALANGRKIPWSDKEIVLLHLSTGQCVTTSSHAKIKNEV